MSDASARIRWTPDEMRLLADAMAQELQAQPRQGMLAALRGAQERVLGPQRRREIKAWSIVQAKLNALLDDAQRRLSDGGVAPSAATDAPAAVVVPSRSKAPGQPGDLLGPGNSVGGVAEAAASGPEASAAESSRRPSQGSAIDVGAMGAALAGAVEAALLAALQCPQVEDAFAQVLGRAMARATNGRDTCTTAAGQAHHPRERRVLVAGFPLQVSRGIEDELRATFDVRRWSPSQPAQLLDTLVRMCSVAVIPEEADEDMSEALRGRALRVVRHAGSTRHLAERLETLLS